MVDRLMEAINKPSLHTDSRTINSNNLPSTAATEHRSSSSPCTALRATACLSNRQHMEATRHHHHRRQLRRVHGRVLQPAMVKSTTTTRKLAKLSGKSRLVCPKATARIAGYLKTSQ